MECPKVKPDLAVAIGDEFVGEEVMLYQLAGFCEIASFVRRIYPTHFLVAK